MDTKKQDRLKTLSKIVSVLAKISKVFCFIGIAGLLMFACVFSVMAKGVNFKKHEIKFADQVVKYEVKDDNLVVYVNDKKQDFDFKITGLGNEMEKLEDLTSDKIITSGLVFTVGEIAILVFAIILLGKVSKLFKNFYKKETPFTNDNTNLIHDIANALVILFIMPIALNVILELMIGYNFNLSVNFTSITLILIAYSAAIIFEYGTMLQEKSKQTIYDEK